jgi:hypothetical protein
LESDGERQDIEEDVGINTADIPQAVEVGTWSKTRRDVIVL